MAKVTPITEHFQHFVKDLQESFWGDLQGQVQCSDGAAEGLSQWVLHQGFCDPLWDVAVADRAHAEKGISAGGDEEVFNGGPKKWRC
jgi:hypothetical protein